MQQIQRTGLAASMMTTSFAQRVQSFSGMNDEQLMNLQKSMTDNYSTMANAHALERQAYSAASALQGQISTLSAQRTSARAQLASTPWYRPFKKAGLRASIASTEGQLATVKTQFVRTKSAAVLASKKGAEFLSPQMKQSNLVVKDIQQTLQARAEERALIMRTIHRAKVQAHNDRMAQQQLLRDRPSMAKEIFMGMIEDMNEASQELRERTEEELELVEQARQQERERPNQQHLSRPRGG